MDSLYAIFGSRTRQAILLLFIFVLSSATTCRTKPGAACYKGRLEIKGICMNYTISVLEGNMDSLRVQQEWTDENTGKKYRNAFRLGSPCNFPSDINEGDQFYFIIDEKADQNCAVCQAYYPTPEKALSIRVIKSCP